MGSLSSDMLVVYGVLLLTGSLLVLGGLFVVGRSPRSISPSTLSHDAHQEAMVQALKQEALRLREELMQQEQRLTEEHHQETFKQLQSLLTNYPSLRRMVQIKPDLPAKNILSLFTTLDALLVDWHYEVIGSAWESVPFDPRLHQADSPDIREGENVYVRFVGYRRGDHILCPAKVSRTLPGGGA
ncbi:MAG: hypothetical protein SFW36_11220 [Leptolyngbyaceae cyanobacterium bins.59]|nr:hypothetical protein [Leptolyngbyaceae cyanobacterium bins.59]